MKVWDLHCDTLYELRRAEKAGAPKSFLHNDLHIRKRSPRCTPPPTLSATAPRASSALC